MKVNQKLKTFAACALTVSILSACGEKTVETAKLTKSTEVVSSASVDSKEVVEVAKTLKSNSSLILDNKTKNGIAVIEGVHYTKLKTPVEVEGLSDNSVLEIFWLGCPHCQNFEKGIRDWKEVKSKDLQLVKMHAVSGNPRWIMDAHIYTSFEKLSKNNEKVMEGLFDLYINQYSVYKAAVKLDQNTKEKGFPSFKLISDYAVASGINQEEFSKEFQSEETKAKVAKDREVFNKAELQGVPAFIVNKEYMITGKDAKSFEDYFQIVEKVAELTKK